MEDRRLHGGGPKSRLTPLRRDIDWQSLCDADELRLRSNLAAASLPAARTSDEIAVSVRASESICPGLWRAGNLLARVLQLNAAVELYPFPAAVSIVRSQPSLDGEPIRIAVSAPVVESFGVREVLFLLGREVGSKLMGQILLPNAGAPAAKRSQSENDYRRLNRLQTLSADRAGLLACQNLDYATLAMVRWLTGISAATLSLRFEELAQEGASLTRRPLHDLNRHEFVLARIANMATYFQSERYARFFGQPDGARGDSLSEANRAGEPKGAVSLPADPPTAAHRHPLAAARPRLAIHVDAATASRRMFIYRAAAWCLFVVGELASGREEALRKWYGEESDGPPDGERSIGEMAGVEASWRDLANEFEGYDREERLGVLRELVNVVTDIGPLPDSGYVRLERIAEALGIESTAACAVIAEFADPPYAHYPFQAEEEVEVQLDGRWVRGHVRQVEASGELRISLWDGTEYRLSPLADLIRPARGRRAG